MRVGQTRPPRPVAERAYVRSEPALSTARFSNREPPKENTDGLNAIGWPPIGDLHMFKDCYADYVHKFRVP